MQRADHVGGFSGLGRVRVVVGEVAIHLIEQFASSQPRRLKSSGRPPATPLPQSITTFMGRESFTSPTILFDVRRHHVCLGELARHRGGDQVAVDDALAQGPGSARQKGLAAQHHLQAVVVRRVVAAGDRHAGVRAEFIRGEVGEAGGYAAHVDGVDAGAARMPSASAPASSGPGQAAVAADGDGLLATGDGFRNRGRGRWRAQLRRSASCRRCRGCHRP